MFLSHNGDNEPKRVSSADEGSASCWKRKCDAEHMSPAVGYEECYESDRLYPGLNCSTKVPEEKKNVFCSHTQVLDQDYAKQNHRPKWNTTII